MRRASAGQAHCVYGDERTFVLPLGYVDASGKCHREAVLRPITGREQQFLIWCSPSAPTAAVTTDLLARCLLRVGEIVDVTPSMVRDLLVGDREFLLLRLYQISFGETVTVLLRCPIEECGEVTEVPLELNEISVEGSPVEARVITIKLETPDERTVSFRLPTGADQEALASCPGLSEDEQSALLMKRCLLSSSTPDMVLGRNDSNLIESRMKQLAPMIDVELEALCPKCSRLSANPVDVPFLVIGEIRARAAALEPDIHSLAFYYHWAESEIVSLTPRMRARYIDLLGQELERIAN